MQKSLLLISLLSVSNVFSQHTDDLSSWQNSHPQVVVIEKLDYAHLTDEQKLLLGENLIIFDKEFTQADIEKYETDKLNHPDVSRTFISEENASEIKTWLYFHPDVKIVYRDYYDSLSIADKELYDAHGVVIIEGKVLTIQDIENYESQN